MDYHFETLGDDKFQKLCQALLAEMMPKVQCLPLNQADGGRDAFSRRLEPKDTFIVFQVKYSRNPSSVDEREAVLALIRSEKAKVERLKARGATEYHLLTNVSGTSIPDKGSINRANEILSGEFGIPAFCWWRDDIERRVDAHSGIKWSYPEILRGSDVLGLLLKSSEDTRTETLNAYLREQYQSDEEVKFKQVELQNKLLNLFVDVPCQVRLTEYNEVHRPFLAIESSHRWLGGESVGAAMWMLGGNPDKRSSRIVLEGAPGQGKSTITQYVCQVHRMHGILDQTTLLALMHPEPRRDLRDDGRVERGRRDALQSAGRGRRRTANQGCGNIVAVTSRALARMARAHQVASGVKQLALQQSSRCAPIVGRFIPMLGANRLHGIPQVLIHNRIVLAGMHFAFVGDQTAIHRIAEHVVERAATDAAATALPATRASPFLRALAVPGQFLDKRRDRFELNESRKDPPHQLGFRFVDHERSIFDIVAKRQVAAHPQSARFGGGELVADALSSDLALELRERQKHVERKPTHRRCGVKRLGHSDEGRLGRIQALDDFGEVRERSRQAVDLVDYDHIDPPSVDFCQQRAQSRAFHVAAGTAAVLEDLADDTPAFASL